MIIQKPWAKNPLEFVITSIQGTGKSIFTDTKFHIKRADNKSENIMIEKEKEISINSTINKARIMSRIIDEEYEKDSTNNQYIFDISQIEQKIQRKVKGEEIVEFFNEMMNQRIMQEGGNQFINALSDLLDGKNSSILCEYKNNEFDGIISYIRKISNGNIDGNNENLKLSTGSNEDPTYPLSSIIQYDGDHIDSVYINYLVTPKSVNIKETWIELT